MMPVGSKEVDRAISILKPRVSRVGGVYEIRQENIARLAALTNLCGQGPCTHLGLSLRGNRVTLRCEKGRSPVELFRYQAPGATVSCEHHST